MTSKKNKGKGISSSSNRDTEEAQYDRARFVSFVASYRFMSIMTTKAIISQRGLRLEVDYFPEISTKI